MDNDKQLIEQAFELVENVDFQKFITRLEQNQTPETIKIWFGGLKEFPDTSIILKRKLERDHNNNIVFQHYQEFPDEKLGLQTHLLHLAKSILFRIEPLQQIRQGATIWLNMEIIGTLWSDSENLIKCRYLWLNYAKTKHKLKKPLSLEDIFESKTDLNKLVKLLEEKKFITIENGSPRWTGIKHDKANGRGLQLVVLSEVCRPLYKLTDYDAKELNGAWTEYFNYKMSPVKWQPGERPADGSDYHQLFRNILHSFSV